MMMRYFFIGVMLFLLVPASGWCGISESQDQLNKIKGRIEQAQENLKLKKKSELKISRELAVLNKTLDQIEKRIAALRKEQKKLRLDIERQKQLINDNRKKTRHVTARLETRLIALYKEGETGPLKILFSADSPTEMVQQYRYLTKVLEHDKQILSEYRQIYKVQKEQLDRKKTLEQEQSQLLEKEKQQREAAAEGRKLNSRLLAQAKKEKGRLKQELKELQENSAQLKKLIGRLKQETVSRRVKRLQLLPIILLLGGASCVGR